MSHVRFYDWSKIHLRLRPPPRLCNQNTGYMFLSLFCEGGCPAFISSECERNLGREASTIPFHLDCEPVTVPFHTILWFLYMVVEIGTRIIYPLALLVWLFCLSSLFPSIQSESPFVHYFFLLCLICIPFIRAQIFFLSEQSKIKYHASCLFFLIKTQKPGAEK